MLQMFKKQNYYYIERMIIDRELKGSGALRQLIEPIITRMQEENLPIPPNTHDPNNVPLYQHFGFELVHKHQAKHNPHMAQYSTVKHPCVH